jgi:thiol-disulfide isomerase/thioredoxin
MRRCAGAAALLILSATAASAQTRDIDGRPISPFAPSGKAGVIVFVASDCPISNSYAPVIAEVCRTYASKGVSCTLAYEDTHVDAAAVRGHVADYNLRGIPATVDASRALADRAHADITPTAIVIDARGEIRYRGRIDNLYINIGRTRQQVTSHDLTDALDAMLASTPVPHPATEALGCYIERSAQ